MKYFIYILLLTIFNNGIFAQTSTFSKLLRNGELGDWELGCNVIALEDSTYIVADNQLSTPDGNFLILYKINNIGEVLWEKKYTIPTGGFFLACFGRFFQTQDGGFALTGFRKKGSYRNAYLVKFDAEGEWLWAKDYGKSEVSERVLTGQQLKNGDYVLTGYGAYSFDSTVVYIVRTDEMGNKKWEKYIDTEKDYGEAVSITENQEGGLILGGLTADRHNWGDDFLYREDGLMIVLDSLGNEVHRRFFESLEERNDCPTHIKSLPQGGYLIWGCEIIPLGSGSNSPAFSSHFVAKLDDNYEIIWQTFLDDKMLENGAGKKKIYKVIALEDGDFLAIGGHAPNWNAVSMWAWIGRFSKEGTLLWDRTYDYFAEDYFSSTDAENEFFDATETLDGGFFLTGRQETIYVYESGGAVGTDNIWIMKVDSMGCLEAGCEGDFFVLNDIDVGIGGVDKLEEELKIFPNPSKGNTTIYFPPMATLTTSELKIYNILGGLEGVYSISSNQRSLALNTLDWERGLYLLSWELGERVLERGKLVIK